MTEETTPTPEETEEIALTPEQEDAILHHIDHIMVALKNPGLSEEEIVAFLNVRKLAVEHYTDGPGKFAPNHIDDGSDIFFRELIVYYLYQLLPYVVERDFCHNAVAQACHLAHADVQYHLKRYRSGKTTMRESLWSMGPDGKLQRKITKD